MRALSSIYDETDEALSQTFDGVLIPDRANRGVLIRKAVPKTFAIRAKQKSFKVQPPFSKWE